MIKHDSRAIARANPANASFIVRFLSGVGHLFWGIKTSLLTPSLFLLSIAVIAANLVVYAGLFYLGWTYSDTFADYIAQALPSVFRWHWMEVTAAWMMVILWAIVCVFLAIVVASALTGPLLDMLSERTEKLLTGEVNPQPFKIWPMIYEIAATVAITVVSIVVSLLLTLLTFWIPVVGQLIPFCAGALFVSLNFVSPAAIRHELTIADRLDMILKNKALLLGFGMPAGIFPFLLVPILTPALVVGGTRLFLALAATERAPGRATKTQVATLLGHETEHLA